MQKLKSIVSHDDSYKLNSLQHVLEAKRTTGNKAIDKKIDVIAPVPVIALQLHRKTSSSERGQQKVQDK